MNKRVRLELESFGVGPFSLLGIFSRQAKKEGWSKGEINFVLDECNNKSRSEDDVFYILSSYCRSITK